VASPPHNNIFYYKFKTIEAKDPKKLRKPASTQYIVRSYKKVQKASK